MERSNKVLEELGNSYYPTLSTFLKPLITDLHIAELTRLEIAIDEVVSTSKKLLTPQKHSLATIKGNLTRYFLGSLATERSDKAFTRLILKLDKNTAVDIDYDVNTGICLITNKLWTIIGEKQPHIMDMYARPFTK